MAEEVALGNIPVGFDLRASPVPLDDASSLRFRGDDKSLLKVRIKKNVIFNDYFLH